MLGVLLFLLNGTWFELKFGPAFPHILMSQYNRCAKDANDSYDKYEWQDTTERKKVFGRIEDWDSAIEVFYPEVIRGVKCQKSGYELVIGIGLGINPIFSSTTPIVSCGWYKADTAKYWRRKTSLDLYSIPVILSYHINIEGKKFKMLTRVGVGWYPTLLYNDTELYNFTQSPTEFKPSNLDYSASLSSLNGVGLDGEVGIGFSPLDFLTVSCGFIGRVAKITGFEGSYKSVQDGIESTGDCVISYWYWKKEGEHKWGSEDKKSFEESQSETAEESAHEKGAVDFTGAGVFFRFSLTF